MVYKGKTLDLLYLYKLDPYLDWGQYDYNLRVVRKGRANDTQQPNNNNDGQSNSNNQNPRTVTSYNVNNQQQTDMQMEKQKSGESTTDLYGAGSEDVDSDNQEVKETWNNGQMAQNNNDQRDWSAVTHDFTNLTQCPKCNTMNVMDALKCSSCFTKLNWWFSHVGPILVVKM